MTAPSPPDTRELIGWEAVPLAGPLTNAAEASSIARAWTPVSVPGHWQLEDAFVAYEGLALFRCRFDWRPAAANGMSSLRFGGVYYAARVWLNGAYVGSHEGYSSSFEFDVTDHVAADGENELLVEVYSPEEREENERETIGGVWASWDGLGPHINPGGIFRGVELVSGGATRIRSLGATADAAGRGVASVEVYAREPGMATLAGRVEPEGFDAPGADFERRVRLGVGVNRFDVGFRLADVRPWSTWDRGGQPLYRVTVGCGGDEGSARFGARTVELRDWNVYLNGERLFLRGINYLPTDVYPARATRGRLRADAALVRENNMNAVRVHVHVAEKAFYEACDELGVFVFQDFPLQWTHKRGVLGPAVRQAREMARDLRAHPSVGVYLAHDEPFYVVPPEKWNPLRLARTVLEVISPRWALWQRRVLGPAVVRALEGEDPSRAVIDAAGHPLTTNHLYFGWYYGRFRDLERAVGLLRGLSRLPTEYGAQALPDPASLAEIWPEGAGPAWDNLSLNFRMQPARLLRYVPWEGDRASLVARSQEYQAAVLKHATELFRRRKYRPTGGTFAFMLNDPAPSISWSVTDWRRRPKAALATLRSAMSPVLFCAAYPRAGYRTGAPVSLPLFVVNDLVRPAGRVRWRWEMLLDGSVVAGEEGTALIAGDAVCRVGYARATFAAPGRALLRLRLSGEDLEGYNEYGFVITR